MTTHWRKKNLASSYKYAIKKIAVEGVKRESFFVWFFCPLVKALVKCIFIISLTLSANAINAQTSITFDIPQQRADLALTDFAQQADLTLIVPFDEVRLITTNRLVGRFRADQAIHRLLKDTGLTATVDQDGQIIVVRSGSDGETSMHKKKSLPSAILIALSGLFGGQYVEAQSEEGNVVLEEVVVTGIRASLQKASEYKRNSEQILDAIVAEDIGKLPDQNIAEALQRVSGVQIRRSASGEGDTVDIRGASNNRTEVNGRTLNAFGGRKSGGSNRNNGGQNLLGVVPSELVGRLEVIKLPAANQIEGAIGGTVNIVTRRPLDDPGLVVAGSVQGVYADLSEDVGSEASGLISNSFKDDTVGVLLGFSYSDRTLREDRFFSYTGWRNVSDDFDVDGDGVSDSNPNGDEVPGYRINDLRYQTIKAERETLGINGALQWQPTDEWDFNADFLYAAADVTDTRDWLSIPTSGNAGSYSSVAFSQNKTMVAGTVNAPIQANTNLNPGNEFTALVLGLGGEWTRGALTVKGDVSYNRTEEDTSQYFLRAQTANSYDIGFDFRNGDIPDLTLPAELQGGALNDPSLYNYTVGFINTAEGTSDETAVRFDVEYDLDLGIISGIEVGTRFTDFTTKFRSSKYTFKPVDANAADPALAGYFGTVDGASVLGDVSGDFPSNFPVVHPNLNGLGQSACEAFSGYGVDCPDNLLNDSNGNSEVNEKTTGGYVKLNFQGDLGPFPFTGNMGVRYVTTDLHSEALSRTAVGLYVPTDYDNDYSDTLPSAVVKMELSDELIFRFGAAKVMARPELSQLTSSLRINETELTARGASPNLNPYRASQFDASLEWYAPSGTILSGAIFYKDIESFIASDTQEEIIPGFESYGPFLVSRNFNTEDKARVKGVELAFQQPLDFVLEGLGTSVNYTFNDSSSPLEGVRKPGESLPLAGVSQHSANAIAYYENGPFGIRLAYSWRDEYLTGLARGAALYTKARSNVSASASYDLTDNLSLSFEAINLTNSMQEQYNTFEDSLASMSYNDRRYSIGIRYRN
jgi:iron complex outermembrane recepter protein